MKSITIENLRSITSSGELPLNNLNIFLGANSTGKSSILRFFPLIKQTISRKTTNLYCGMIHKVLILEATMIV